ncbi:unnamed protein product, partial [marine sediment metagenome]
LSLIGRKMAKNTATLIIDPQIAQLTTGGGVGGGATGGGTATSLTVNEPIRPS